MTDKLNPISLNAHDVWEKLDAKDDTAGMIKKPVWDAFREYTGVKANTIRYGILKKNAIRSIEAYLAHASDAVKQKIAEFCGLNTSGVQVQPAAEQEADVPPQTNSEAADVTQLPMEETVLSTNNSPAAKPQTQKANQPSIESYGYQVNEQWGENWVAKNSRNRKVAQNTQDFDAYFERAAATYNIPKSVLQGICMKESTMGVAAPNNIMQLEPGTARENGCRDISNPEENIMAAARYLRKMIDKSDGNIARALVAYNAGPGSKAYRNWNGIYSGGYADRVLALSQAYERMDENYFA